MAKSIDDGSGGRVLLASPQDGVIAHITMNPVQTDFWWVTSDGLHFGPIMFRGQRGNWTIRGPNTAAAKKLGPIPAGYQRYAIVDQAGNAKGDITFTQEWVRVSAWGGTPGPDGTVPQEGKPLL